MELSNSVWSTIRQSLARASGTRLLSSFSVSSVSVSCPRPCSACHSHCAQPAIREGRTLAAGETPKSSFNPTFQRVLKLGNLLKNEAVRRSGYTFIPSDLTRAEQSRPVHVGWVRLGQVGVNRLEHASVPLS